MHTKGPFKAVSAFIANAPNRALVAVGGWGGPNIADCGEDSPETMANARLFAAAPELLEACKYMRNWLQKNGDWDDAFDSCAAAIAKATSE